MNIQNKITTEVRDKKKPHKKFKATFQFDSQPTELTIEADKTDVNVKSLSKNPNKFSFGKVVSQNKNTLEFYMYPYPHGSLDHIDLSFKKDFSSKTNVFIVDRHKLDEILRFIMRIRYFMSLSTERKQKYLQNHGFFGNINITKGDDGDD